MKRTVNLLTILALVAFVIFYATPQAFAQSEEAPKEEPAAEHGPNFVDENGDGYNDNAPDDDGDGIPNGQDPDYVKPNDGTATGKGNGKGNAGTGFVDEDGDGFNDNAPDDDGDGIPNGQDEDYVKPADGTGAGKGEGQGQGKGKGKRFAGFIDEDGDGINDRMVDDDNDGIPNGKDADWVRPEDCLGRGANMGGRFGNSGSTGTSGNNGNTGGNGNGNGNGGGGRP